MAILDRVSVRPAIFQAAEIQARKSEKGNEQKGNKNIINLVFAGKLKKSVREKINQWPDKISERPPVFIVRFSDAGRFRMRALRSAVFWCIRKPQ